MSEELIGKVISGYEIIRQIGEGGMATVYLANQQSMNRQVAIKVLPKHLVKDDTYMERFRREVDIASKLEHRNIIPVYDYGEYEGQPFIVMRYMPAGSLDDILQNGPMPPESIYKLINQIAPALDYAHSKQVLHRDLKPSNVLMDDDGGAFLTDFGIARVVGDNNPGLTKQGVVGTPSYMSPEQAQGKELDGRSDVYSLGVMLFEMSTGRRPFESETPYSIAVMQVTDQPPMPRDLNPTISTALEAVILKSLKKSRDDRYQTGVALAESLRMAIERPDRSLAVLETEPRLKMSSYQEILADEITKKPEKSSSPPPPLSSASRPVVPPPRSLRSRIRYRRKTSPLWNALVGGLIGMGLLGIVVAGVFLAYTFLFPEISGTSDDGTQTATLASIPNNTNTTRVPDTSVEFTAIPTLDPTNEAARATLLARVTPTVAPSEDDTDAVPVNESALPELLPALEIVSGTLIFADERITDSETLSQLLTLDFDTGRETQLTQTTTGTNSYPVVSPDRRWIAFQSNRDGNFEIYLTDLDGGQVQRLTNNSGLDRLPAWSPDGQWVIYASETDTGAFDLRRINIDTGEDEIVLSNNRYNGHARYSPDGQTIVFTQGDSLSATNTWEIALLDLASGDVTRLTDNGLRDGSPVFSPDGERILYITYNAATGSDAIAEMALDGTQTRIVFDSDGSEWSANYSPDGQFIVFTSDITGQNQLYLTTREGDAVQQITTDGGNYASWLP
ncbi:MAG: protein kinase domain-containing protein [Anaerolineae bacterium]